MAAILAFRQIGRSGQFWPYWCAIAGALSLMVMRRMIPLISILADSQSSAERPLQTITGFAISLLMAMGIFGIRRLFQELDAQKRYLMRLSREDSLTLLFNRRHMMELAEEKFRSAKRFKRPLSVLMIDIDRFKLINDRFGHEMGDRSLKEAALRIREHVRDVDLVGRWGGEEFLVLLPEAELHEGLEIAERIRLGFADSRSETTPHITVSVGLAFIRPGDERIEELIDRSDRAMYTAKDAGRNCVRSL